MRKSNFFFSLLFQVTKDVSLLSRWMAIDLYIREADNLRFELSMNQCSDRLSRLAHEILEEGFAFFSSFEALIL
jgi:phosphoenolpyruvate carboxylase